MMIINCPYCKTKMSISIDSWADEETFIVWCQEQRNVQDSILGETENRRFCNKSFVVKSTPIQPIIKISKIDLK